MLQVKNWRMRKVWPKLFTHGFVHISEYKMYIEQYEK